MDYGKFSIKAPVKDCIIIYFFVLFRFVFCQAHLLKVEKHTFFCSVIMIFKKLRISCKQRAHIMIISIALEVQQKPSQCISEVVLVCENQHRWENVVVALLKKCRYNLVCYSFSSLLHLFFKKQNMENWNLLNGSLDYYQSQ